MSLSKNRELNNILKIGSKNLNSENWKVYHPNGNHMFTCGEKKAKWYLDRDLAFIDDEKKIVLSFYPKGNGFEDNEVFGKSIRETKCVVSGISDGLQRHHIVPYCYRTYFPDVYKSKNHHDVVLINHELHSIYEQFATQYKDEIALIYGIKTISELNTEYVELLRENSNSNLIPMNLIHSLFKSYGVISKKSKLAKFHQIAEHTNIPFEKLITYNYVQLYNIYLYLKKIYEAEKDKYKLDNRMYYDHGYHLSLKLDTEEKIENFVKLWRKHFIDTMQPKYMPEGWSIDFRFKTKL